MKTKGKRIAIAGMVIGALLAVPCALAMTYAVVEAICFRAHHPPIEAADADDAHALDRSLELRARDFVISVCGVLTLPFLLSVYLLLRGFQSVRDISAAEEESRRRPADAGRQLS